MRVRRRNFIKIAGLVWAAVISGFSVRANPKTRGSQITVFMPSDDGDYTMRVDGREQLVRIIDNIGEVTVPHQSCTLEYNAPIGPSNITVYIDEGTTMLSLMPGRLLTDNPTQWEVALLGNPVVNGIIRANIIGPVNTTPVLEVTDINGRLLLSQQVSKTKFSQEFETNIQSYAKGTLLFTVKCDSFSETMKVIHGQ